MRVFRGVAYAVILSVMLWIGLYGIYAILNTPNIDAQALSMEIERVELSNLAQGRELARVINKVNELVASNNQLTREMRGDNPFEDAGADLGYLGEGK